MPSATGWPPAGSTNHLTARAILFLLWFAVGNAWLTRHMGVAWDSPWFAAVLTGLGTAFAAIEAATGAKFNEYLIGRLTLMALNWRVIGVMWTALLVAVAGWSSVTILNDPPNTAFDATLTQADRAGGATVHEDNIAKPDKPVQFAGVWAGGLGRPYRLDVKGYLPQMVNVYPLSGVSISARKDLRVMPSLLLRPPPEVFRALAGGVKFELTAESPPAAATMASGTVTQQSILVGTDQPIPQQWLEGWRLDLVARRITNESLLAQVLDAWKHPFAMAPQKPLEPGKVLKAVIYNATKQAIAEGRVTLSEERFQDCAMTPVMTDQAKGVGR